MIKVVAFDFGDVLVKDTFKAIEKQYWTKKTPAAAGRKLLAAIHKVDSGKADEAFLVRAIGQTLTPHLSKAQIHRRLMSTKLLPPWKIMLKASKHYPIAILTNNYKTGPATFSKILKINLSPYTIVNSSRIGVRKPHKNFYLAALKRLRVRPEELLFIDDVAANVSAAKKLGIPAFRYDRNMAQLKAFLKKHGIKGV